MFDIFGKASVWINESQVMVAVIFGAFVQFFFGKTKNAKVAVTVVVSSIFVALYIVPPIVELLRIASDGSWAITLYALSSVVSIEILSMVIAILPLAMRERVEEYLQIMEHKEPK